MARLALPVVRIATWNVNSVTARLPRLLEWLESRQPDVACLQELKVSEDAFPHLPVQALGYEAAIHADGRWNGVAVLSRVGLEQISRGLVDEPGFPEPECRAVAATCSGVRVRSVYVPNGRTPDDPHYAYKLRWLAALRATLATEMAEYPSSAVMGDFNVAPTDADVWDPARFVGSTHVTAAERAALAEIRALGLTDVIPRPGKGRTPSRTGTTGPGPSTRTGACGSTTSTPPDRWR
jgi:exodeoxyribonuclease III